MEITVDSNPEAKIEWFKGNGTVFKQITTNVQLQTVVVITDFEHKYISRLRFPGGVKRTDQGSYLIRTKNLLGEVDKRTYLNVQCEKFDLYFSYCHPTVSLSSLQSNFLSELNAYIAKTSSFRFEEFLFK